MKPTRTTRGLVAAACVLALVAGAWWAVRRESTSASTASSPVGATDAPTRTKTPRTRAADAATQDAPSSSTADASEKRAAPGRLAFHVTLRATGAPAVGAKVVVTDEGKKTYEATTDADGVARIAEASPSDGVGYVITLAGFATRSSACGIESDVETTVNDALERVVVVEGVVREEDGRPLAGAHVVVPNWYDANCVGSPPPYSEATSDAAGAFRLDQVPVERAVSIFVSARRHVSKEIERTSATPDFVEVRLAPAAAIAGVVRGPDGKTVADARVVASPASVPDARFADVHGDSATSDAAGRYEVDDLPFGCTWTVVASAHGFWDSDASKSVALSAAHPEATCDLTLNKAGRIEVTVVDPSGAPAAGAVHVVLDRGNWLMRKLGPDGCASFDIEKPGHREVEVDVKGFPPDREEVDVAIGETTKVGIQLAAGVVCSGVVVDETANPVVGAGVWKLLRSFQRIDDNERHATTGADGSFRLDALEPGRAEIFASADGFESADATPVDVPANDVRIVLRRSPPDGEVSLAPRVRDGASTPANFDVWFVPADGRGGSYGFKCSDAALVKSLAPGNWHALIRAGDLAAVRDFEVVTGKRTDLGEVVVEPCLTLRGRIVDATGKPVSATSVEMHDASVQPDVEGRFAVPRLPPGAYSLECGGEQWFSQKVEYTLAADSPPLVVTLLRGGLLRGLVRDDAGLPIRDAKVVAESEPVEGYVLEDEPLDLTKFGGFSKRLPAGRWRVVVRRDDAVLATKHVELVENGETTVDFIVRR
jgi:hypothetical protein